MMEKLDLKGIRAIKVILARKAKRVILVRPALLAQMVLVLLLM